MINEKNKNAKGITLISLVVAIAVLMIVSNIIIYYAKDNLKVGKLKAMQSDIANLRDKISSYYAQNGAIPAKIKYTNINHIKESGVISSNVDIGDFYVIDLSALENLTLNYGRDFEKVKEDSENSKQYKDLYIINETSHNIFYVEGIQVDNDIFYTDYTKEEIDTKAVSLRYIENVKIPEGFYYVGGTKETGIVISDELGDDLNNTKKGNQFVWIPVENINDFHTIEGYYRQKLDNRLPHCSEPDENGYNEEVAEYNRMKESVKENKGFYMGRFEAGKVNNQVVVQKDVPVYTNIKWGTSKKNITGGVVELAKKFAEGKNYTDVTTTLCYGVQWDATMQFIDNNYIKGTCQTDSYIVNSKEKANDSGNILNTGSNDAYAIKNIYDLAGNVAEWTMESGTDLARVYRGGWYSISAANLPASYRGYQDANGENATIGFRITLYLNKQEKWSPSYDERGTYKDKNGDTAYIPKGFQVSEQPGENTIYEGLVVKAKDNSEFIWVPVKDINAMATKLSGVDSNGRTNYQGKLYNFSQMTSTQMKNYGQGTTSYREPDIISSYDNNTSYNKGIVSKSLLQREYNTMIESVQKYGGFYIGRYETSINGQTVASKAGVIPMKSNNFSNRWYDMYQKQKEYTNQNNFTTLCSSMIWGSQYDAVLNWILTGNDKAKVTANNVSENHTNGVVNTGTIAADKMNNIYDLEGNLWEWTLESYGTDMRVIRGGAYFNYDDNSPSSRYVGGTEAYPNTGMNYVGSRMILYNR